jgi:hypothetical protein
MRDERPSSHRPSRRIVRQTPATWRRTHHGRELDQVDMTNLSSHPSRPARRPHDLDRRVDQQQPFNPAPRRGGSPRDRRRLPRLDRRDAQLHFLAALRQRVPIRFRRLYLHCGSDVAIGEVTRSNWTSSRCDL